ncbi:MAG: hypothetical protein B6D56_05410 [Candidatus Omnitrophica bacterium 4484_70.1]|nr:MAG: hypothetical protein B6D56_05410 [Candidatus Omnitrophica bacterium 4484_70.1]
MPPFFDFKTELLFSLSYFILASDIYLFKGISAFLLIFSMPAISIAQELLIIFHIFKIYVSL